MTPNAMSENGLHLLEHPTTDELAEINGYSIREMEKVRQGFEWMRWQAGRIVTEFRYIPLSENHNGFRGKVSLFYLLGHGATRDEAIAMANKRSRRAQN